MNKVLIIISTLVWSISFGQETIIENDTLILWDKKRPLAWEDFKGMVKTPQEKYGIYTAAGTAAGPIFIHKTDKNGNMLPYPLTYFYKSISWSISKDSVLLSHEQLHFDIWELFIRKLRMGYKELSENNVYDNAAYDNLYTQIFDSCMDMQNEYDKEVRFNKPKQQEWINKINNELKELKEYEFTPETINH